MAASTPKSTSKSRSNYADPNLRERLKDKIIAGTKGGKAGQWSARKAQLLAHEYESAGGKYNGPRTGAQKHLKQWTDEHWQTSDGKPAARSSGTTRYLPKKAWSKLTEAEKAATNTKKKAGSKTGKQFVANTAKAKKVGAATRKRSKPSTR